VDSVSKPALIIDGQHRVFGAKDVTEGVQLPIVLMRGLPAGEQVFNFYVLNNKAKPLNPTELRRTISTSLTNQEIDKLWDRFEEAGVNPEATRWTHKMNTDPASPFMGLVDFGLGGDGFIRENVAFQVVSKFVRMPRKYRVLYRDLQAWIEESDDRLQYFYAFWRALRARYRDQWTAGAENGGLETDGRPNQLFMKSAMLVLQEYVLDLLVQMSVVRRIDGKASPLADLTELEELVVASLEFLPPVFFSREWSQKQLDTTAGRKFIYSQMQNAVQNQGTHIGNLPLFKKA
jgi:hypothetical protein